MAVVALKDLLNAGVHFGHQTSRWNPKMKRFIFEERDGIYIIDLQKTQRLLDYATQYVRNVTQKGGTVLFVGTKKKIRDIMKEEAESCTMPYVNERWLGGLLTNMQTIRKSMSRLEEIEELERDGTMAHLPKKEQSMLNRELTRLRKNLGGIRDMKQPPDVVFIVDIRREHLSLLEAKKLNIPVVALVDTNCDPEFVDFVIPGNDDAISSTRLIAGAISDAIREGRQFYMEVEKERTQRAKEMRARRGEGGEPAKAKATGSKRMRTDKAKQLQEQLLQHSSASAAPEEETVSDEESEKG